MERSMPETQPRIRQNLQTGVFPLLRIEPVLVLAIGGFGGLLESAVISTSLLKSVLLGASFGFTFALLFVRRATSPGAGLIWGLGSAFLLWILTAGGLCHFVVTNGHSTTMIQDAQGSFPELVANILCFGMPVGAGLGIRGAWRVLNA